MKFSRKFFGSLQVHTGYLTFSLKKAGLAEGMECNGYDCD